MKNRGTYLSRKIKRSSRMLCKATVLSALLSVVCINGYGQQDGLSSFPTTPFSSTNLRDTNYIFLGDTTKGSPAGAATWGQNEPVYDEIYLTLHVQRIGSMEIPAIIYGNDAYLPVKDIFDYLKLRITATPEFDSLSGFFIHPSATFLIDQSTNHIHYQNKTFHVGTLGMIRTETNLYLRSDLFGKVFGLDCQFDFRSLSVMLNSKTELPAIREMQQELMRRNITKLRGERKADTTIRPRFSLLRLGTADWMVLHQKEGETINNTRATLALGALFAGGEANVFLNYNSNQPFSERQQLYSWKYVNNENKVVRQLTAGKIFAQSTSSIFSPMKGFHVTNAPSTYRTSFGTYRLSDHTEPGWTVELYVNNVLVNYMKADASGFYSFDVPLVYGTSVMQLRFYGPWGEERTRDVNISIPFNFLPLHQLEYSLSAGIVDDDRKDRFSRAVMNYGLSRRITIGSGVEYLTSANAGRIMPFAQASLRIGASLLLSGEHVRDVRSKGVLSYRLPSNLQFDLHYINYQKEQTAVRFNFLQEKKATMTVPFRGKNFSAFSRLIVSQFTTATQTFTTSELILSSVIAGISSNLTTLAMFNGQRQPLVFSNLSMAFRFPKGFRITPHLQYEYREKNFSMLKFELEKTISGKGFFNLSYEKDVVNQGRYISLGLRYNFSFAQTFFSTRNSSTGVAVKTNSQSTLQMARGSLIYDDHSKKFTASNQNNVGKGGLLFLPFLDLNCNGRREANEPDVRGLKMRINGGRLEVSKKDSSIRVLGLEPYTSYFVELDKHSFDNIAWQLKNATMRITIEPDHFKQIEVPVAVVGEVSGTVLLRNERGENGLGRIIVNIYNSDKVLVGKTLTEQDGYFSYLGLAPGNYTVVVDEAQLKTLRMTSTPPQAFRINASPEGDVRDDLQLVVEPQKQ